MKNLSLFSALLLCFSLMACHPVNKEEPVEDELIARVTLDEDVVQAFKVIFSDPEYKIDIPFSGHENTLCVIKNENELREICPSTIEMPTIDFSQYCLIYAKIFMSSADRIQSFGLYYCKETCSYTYKVCILRRLGIWSKDDVIMRCPYGVYQLSAEELKSIKLEVSFEDSYEDNTTPPSLSLF